MNQIRNAFRFIAAAYQQAFKQPMLFMPTLYTVAGGQVLLVVFFIPIALVFWLAGISPLGLFLIGFFYILLMVAQLCWAEATGLMTAALFFACLTKEPPDFISANKRLFARFLHVFAACLAYPANLMQQLAGGQKKPGKKATDEQQPAKNPHWHNALYLLTPILALENLPLDQAVLRVKALVEAGLVRFNPKLVNVRLLVWLFTALCTLGGLALATWVGFKVADGHNSGRWRLLAAFVAALITSIFLLVSAAINNYCRSSYYTTLYRWAIALEQDGAQAQSPQILANVLSGKKPLGDG